MTHMTPEQAQHVLHDNITPPEPGSTTYYAQSFRALETLAADTLEYGITFVDESTIYWVGDDRHAAELLREAWINRGAEVDPLVCRRVSEPWEVTDE